MRRNKDRDAETLPETNQPHPLPGPPTLPWSGLPARQENEIQQAREGQEQRTDSHTQGLLAAGLSGPLQPMPLHPSVCCLDLVSDRSIALLRGVGGERWRPGTVVIDLGP